MTSLIVSLAFYPSDQANKDLSPTHIEPHTIQGEDQTDNFLPIHGPLHRNQLERYYPGVLDTVKDVRVIGAEKINILVPEGHYASMLHNTGTFDQMFFCVHDSDLRLIDSYYIGMATMFDGTGHTIEHDVLADTVMALHHVDWGWFPDERIDTVRYYTYKLVIDGQGTIGKQY